MSANSVGKGLVLLHLAMSVLALAWAAAIFFQFTDWGWKEPRKELEYRVASELDKRAAALKVAQRGRDMVYHEIKPAQVALRQAENSFPYNSLWYDSELKRLKEDKNEIEVKELKYEGGILELDSPGKLIGKPVLENPVPQIKQSYATYLKELRQKEAKGDKVAADVRQLVMDAKDATFQLNGIDDDGKKVKPGLYDLLNIEYDKQAQLKFEMEYMQPIWVDALKEAEIYRARRVRLEEAVARARAARGK